ncbi:uncharacterized protein K489DRAFT_385395 [Dissoconium aciculare CBS 342.82]|jgi:hypothetical protein|uniref:Uncharacterized protein n=1 Tax=Dissoconium aciculare CBS 342.82 TaxID=1314786 RepID=A0A6J3LPW4_9PEZI|nr:uncharacterized protein K489DRAFT_385395 [Dissoconium aciculare CBS 342.82]KAF1817905.1 hypothetical protein K489DRAFT_385395 [Dissoconium aciculare CBS 342.82]
MKTRFRGGIVWRGFPDSRPEQPNDPEPAPIPIKLVADPPPPPSEASPEKTNRTDDFYLGERQQT